jgi:hypothetical protein
MGRFDDPNERDAVCDEVGKVWEAPVGNVLQEIVVEFVES